MKKLKEILTTIAVKDTQNRYDAITKLLEDYGIKYTIQKEEWTRDVPIYEKTKTNVEKDSLHFCSINDKEEVANFLDEDTFSDVDEEIFADTDEIHEKLCNLAMLYGFDEEVILSMSTEELLEIAEGIGLDLDCLLEEDDIEDRDDYEQESNFSIEDDFEKEIEGEKIDDSYIEDEAAGENILLPMGGVQPEQMSFFDDDLDFYSSYSSYNRMKGYRGISSLRSNWEQPKIIGYNKIDESVKNIVIPLSQYSKNESDKKIVFMAHYDAVPGSTGANDNGSSIAILIAFAMEVIGCGSDLPMEIVFTDKEETGGYGSRLYLKQCKDQILEVINLDTCGVGDDIVTCDWSKHPSGLTWRLIYDSHLMDLKPVFVRSLPYCDADIVKAEGIDVTGICTLPPKDVEGIIYGKATYTGVYEYMHNGKKDSIDYINYDIMEKILEYLLLLL